MRQFSVGSDVINIYEIGETNPPAVSGELHSVSNPGGPAAADASVSCALFTSCSNTGAVWQTAIATQHASNQAIVAGALTVEAIARATGSEAVAEAEIGTHAVRQRAQGLTASNSIEVAGSAAVVAQAVAAASVGDAEGRAMMTTSTPTVTSSVPTQFTIRVRST